VDAADVVRPVRDALATLQHRHDRLDLPALAVPDKEAAQPGGQFAGHHPAPASRRRLAVFAGAAAGRGHVGAHAAAIAGMIVMAADASIRRNDVIPPPSAELSAE